MKKMKDEVNNFLTSTTIHGLAYISDNESRFTRFIWILIVTAALSTASYFLYQTVEGYGTKFTSTTIETRSIQDFPFPAVTFHSGDFTSRTSFLQTFLNQFEFTRYEESSQMRENEKFYKQFDWLIVMMNDEIFEGVEKFLIKEQRFIKSKGGRFRSEICSLVLLQLNRISFKKRIRKIFMMNMYKYKSYQDSVFLLKNEIFPLILEATTNQNLTKRDIDTACKASENQRMKTEISATLLSYMFLFINWKNTATGAGDLATSLLNTGLNHGKNASYYYEPSHTLISNIYNYIFNSSLPVSVLEFPQFFGTLDKQSEFKYNTTEWSDIRGLGNIVKLSKISDEEIRNYHFLWRTFNNFQENFTLFCRTERKTNCSDPKNFRIAERRETINMAKSIRENPSKGKVFDGQIYESPCTQKGVVKKFKIQRICDLQSKMSENKEAFLKLMVFTKQSPIFKATETFIGAKEALELYNYTLKENEVS